MDIIFNIKQAKMGCVTFLSTQHDLFIKRIKWIGLGQPISLIGQVRIEGFDMIIKWVRLGLNHLVEYPYLDTT